MVGTSLHLHRPPTTYGQRVYNRKVMENEKEQLADPLPEDAGDPYTSDLKENDGPATEDISSGQPAGPNLEPSPSYEKLKEEKAQLYERLLRKQADLENFRKRAQREKDEHRQHATEDLIRTLLPVLDGFDRALRQRDASAPKPFYQGMELIHRQLFDVLTRAGLEAIDTSGQLFDPNYHQAVETVEDAARREMEIVEELQKGYKLKHRLLRPAIVKVSVKPKAAGSQASE
jgi:molecular chaperone GrpE